MGFLGLPLILGHGQEIPMPGGHIGYFIRLEGVDSLASVPVSGSPAADAEVGECLANGGGDPAVEEV